jgi:hypothetical protein
LCALSPGAAHLIREAIAKLTIGSFSQEVK